MQKVQLQNADKPCPICADLNGNIYGIDDPDRPEIPIHAHCYSNDTEIYTRNGWKRFNQLVTNDEVITLDPDTFELEWQKPINFIS